MKGNSHMGERSRESYRLAVSTGEIQVHRSFGDPDGDFAVVFVHGFGSTSQGEKARAVEEACARRGWTFAACDFRGHGDSTGTMLELTGSRLLEDLDALAADLGGRGAHRLFLVGSSMGGWAAAWFAIRRPQIVPACVAMAPAFDFLRQRWSQLSPEARAAWQRTGRYRVRNEWLDTEIGYALVEEMDRFPVERLTAEWSRPLRIFHGTHDETIPHAQSVAFVEQCRYSGVELRSIPAGDHRLNRWKDEMAESACEFFAGAGAATR